VSPRLRLAVALAVGRRIIGRIRNRPGALLACAALLAASPAAARTQDG